MSREGWEGVLTRRQAETLDLVAQGLTDKAIAALQVVEQSTVKYHLGRVYEAIGVAPGENRRVMAARWWWEHCERPAVAV